MFSSAKTSMMCAMILISALALAACNTNADKLTTEQQTRLNESKVLPRTMPIEAGAYAVTGTCADEAKTAKLASLHWSVKVRADGYYMDSQQNFDPACEDACSVVAAGSLAATDLQVAFNVTKKLNVKTNAFEDVSPVTSKSYYVSSYNRTAGKLILIDDTNENLCQGKMILTLQK